MRLATQPASVGDLPGADHVIERHRDVLRRFEDVAERFHAQGQTEDAIATAAVAMHFAALNHPGVLASERIDALLEHVSGNEVAAQPVRTPAAGRQRVLAVVTETYAVGAHTRVLWRWIARDPGRIYTVVTTQQSGVMPEGVRAAVASSGGEIVDFPPLAPALARAEALRGLAAEADLVVLLDHPYDPLPTLAFAGMEDRPPIVMMNHGDHLPWTGRGVVDVLMCIRPAGVNLAARRGFPSERVLRTSFPVSGPDEHGRPAAEPLDPALRAQARADVLSTLGWPEDAIVLVTVGSDYKYAASFGAGLLDLLEPVLLSDPRTHLVAAGPVNAGRWQALRERTNGRVVALGDLAHGVGALHAAGDIYVESRPFGGPGASAEAAAYGLPVVSGGDTPLAQEVFATDPGYGASVSVDNTAYRALLERLIDDAALRADVGDAARVALAAADQAWEEAVERAYAGATSLGPISPAELSSLPEPGEVDRLIEAASPPARRVPIEQLEQIVSTYELLARSPWVRGLFGALNPPGLRQERRYNVLFAAPSAHEDELRAIVAEFRTLLAAGVATSCLMALRPEDADAAVPVLEAAIAAGPDIDIDLLLHAEPLAVRPPASLNVVVADDDGDPDRANRHLCAAAIAAV
jgi:glycosyltransferase involved in cell wall biosynthesis